MEARELLLRHLPVIDRIIASICRRSGMDSDATEEFAAEVRLRLIKDDYAILRAFQGRSRFETYIAAVVRRLLIDHRHHEYGKWHASAEAERLGDVAIKVERLLVRDGHTIEEAVLMLKTDYPNLTYADVEAIADRLPSRLRRRRVSLDEAVMVHTSEFVQPERAELAARISSTINAFIDKLDHDDQLIFRLRFDSEMTVAQIARSLHLDQQLLYRRLYKHFNDLREALKAAEITASDVEYLIGDDSAMLDFRLNEDRPRAHDWASITSDKETSK